MFFYTLKIHGKAFENKINDVFTFTSNISDNNDLVNQIVNKMLYYSYLNKENIYIICNMNNKYDMIIDNEPQLPVMKTTIFLDEKQVNVIDNNRKSIYTFISNKYDCVHHNSNINLFTSGKVFTINYYNKTYSNIEYDIPFLSLTDSCEILEPSGDFVCIYNDKFYIENGEDINQYITELYEKGSLQRHKLNIITYEKIPKNVMNISISNTIEDSKINVLNPYNIIQWFSNVHFYQIFFDEEVYPFNYIYEYISSYMTSIQSEQHEELFMTKKVVTNEDYMIYNIVDSVLNLNELKYDKFLNDLTLSVELKSFNHNSNYTIIITIEPDINDYITFHDNGKGCYNNLQVVKMRYTNIVFFPSNILGTNNLVGKYLIFKIYGHISKDEYNVKWLYNHTPFVFKPYVSIPNKYNNKYIIVCKKYYKCVEITERIEDITNILKNQNECHVHYIFSEVSLTNAYIENHKNINNIFNMNYEINDKDYIHDLYDLSFVDNYHHININSKFFTMAKTIFEKYVLRTIPEIYGDNNNLIIKACNIHRETNVSVYSNKYAYYDIFSDDLYIYCTVELNNNFEYIDTGNHHNIGLTFIYTRFNHIKRPLIKSGEKYTLEFLILKKDYQGIISGQNYNSILNHLSLYRDKLHVCHNILDYRILNDINREKELYFSDLHYGYTVNINNTPNFTYKDSVYSNILNNILQNNDISNSYKHIVITFEILNSGSNYRKNKSDNTFVMILIQESDEPVGLFLDNKRLFINNYEYFIHNGIFETTTVVGKNSIVFLQYELVY